MTVYISTRGQALELNFDQVTLAGLASDGGLYVPKYLPAFSALEISAFSQKTYIETASAILRKFVGVDFPLDAVVTKSYSVFDHPDTVPLIQLDDHHSILELFHGPTLAFKDFALQFLGHAFEHVLTKTGRKVTIVVATSGDTGSAAIDAFKNRSSINIAVLHPKGRISEVQRRQMTTVQAANVMNIAVEGSFDDCQAMVKSMFADAVFRDAVQLSAVNSINWARIAAQVVYYAYASLRVTGGATFCVPTGNFGNVYAGYIARMLGFPVRHLIVATNSNDILHRFFSTGEMKKGAVVPSLSPSMDIQVSSNFERLLFDSLRHDGAATAESFSAFAKDGQFSVPADILQSMRRVFSSGHADDAQTLQTIKLFKDRYGYVADPHTAVGLAVASQWKSPVVTLATAHPAKFPDAVEQAIGKRPALPPHMQDIFTRKEFFDTCGNDRLQVQAAIRNRFHL